MPSQEVERGTPRCSTDVQRVLERMVRPLGTQARDARCRGDGSGIKDMLDRHISFSLYMAHGGRLSDIGAVRTARPIPPCAAPTTMTPRSARRGGRLPNTTSYVNC